MDDSTTDEMQIRKARAIETVAGYLKWLIDPDQIVELRALKVQDGKDKQEGGSTWAAVYRGTELHLMAKDALGLSKNCQGVYYTLNPLKPEQFQNRTPRLHKATANELAHDKHVIERRWMLVDVDPIRAEGHKKDSATDQEKAHAFSVVMKIREYLTDRGWGIPIMADSGNGYHLLYRLAKPIPVVLPLSESDLIRQTLKQLWQMFSNEHAEVDTGVFNPSRIVKLPGTFACKGESTAERPHRRSRLILDEGGQS